MINGIFLLLGGNLGKPHDTFTRARGLLTDRKVQLIQQSSLYKSAAWGKNDQPDFINMALQVNTSLPPLDLLNELLDIERNLGRERKERWGPRIIDIDLLYYNNQILKSTKLTIPHPEIQNRRFALVPLCEIAPDFIHPEYKKSQQWLLANCKDDLIVRKFM